MTEIGYFLSSEEHGPAALTRFAQMGGGGLPVGPDLGSFPPVAGPPRRKPVRVERDRRDRRDDQAARHRGCHLPHRAHAPGDRGARIAAVKVCWGEDEAASRRLAHEVWATTGVPGELNQEL